MMLICSAYIYLLHTDHYILLLLLTAGIGLSIGLKKLTIAAAFSGGVIAFLLFQGAGLTGVSLLAGFFIPAVMATSWHRKMKETMGVAERKRGRDAGQVVANGGLAALAGAFAWMYPSLAVVFHLIIAAAFSSAAADTISSELGTVYGKRFFNILSLKKDERGLNGVVSYEGLLFGLGASAIIALIYVLGFGWSPAFFWIIIAGTVGNLADSVLGASLERRGMLGNNAVNFLNTMCGAAICVILHFLFP